MPRPGALSATGNTPLIALGKRSPQGAANVYVKWEGANPTGSMKDGVPRGHEHGAERRGRGARRARASAGGGRGHDCGGQGLEYLAGSLFQ